MKNKKIRIIISLFAVVLCIAAFPLSAFAYVEEEITTEATTETEAADEQETEETTINPVSLTPDGNLTLVDDIEGEQVEDKQFITVVSKNGNYFYIVIDRAGDSDNVYFLNLVDEADLTALIEDMDTTTTQPTTVTTEPEPDPEPTTEPEPEAEEKSSNIGGILLIVLVLAAGGGAFYYFKIMKPKQATQGSSDLSELDELDFDSDDDFMSMGADEPEQEDGEE